jgi:hypothetical protein
MTAFAPNPLSVRQTLVRGKVFEAVTNRSFGAFTAVLSFTNSAGQGLLPAKLMAKRGGHYALQLDPAREMPDLSKNGPVTLKLVVTIPGRDPLAQTKNIPAAQFALVSRPVKVGDQMLSTRVLAGAPFVFDFTLPAKPVGLRGIVLKKHDPDQPLAGVKIRAGNAPQVLTAANGRFAINALPVTEAVSIQLEGTGPIETVTFRPDYELPVNTITLSLGS